MALEQAGQFFCKMKIEHKPNPYHPENVAVINFENTEDVFTSAVVFFSKYLLEWQTIAEQIVKPGTKPEITVRIVQTSGPNWDEIPEGYNVFAIDYQGRGNAFRQTPDELMGTFMSPDFDFKYIGEFPLSMYGIQYRPGYEPK